MRYATEEAFGLSPRDIEIAEDIIGMKATKTTFKEIAEKHSISDRQLRNIRRQKVFREYIRERTLERFEDEQGDILAVLVAKAKQGNMKAIQIYTDIVGLKRPNQIEVKTELRRSTRDLSNEELEAEFASIQAELAELLGKDEEQILN
ncbi:hypothetical protein [Sporosarcina sp. HYO08]|uniref:hypothetical protein n=1 Tax=Sporosarcina sp. HYO08 TaxID=1759557 RepID=UPI000791D734|nr:hypothetical protein [Sporosarcina sp. HYO08]KXH87370.1 hypothetical protein AU377_02010 [Sporosarcina sp. HYO08]